MLRHQRTTYGRWGNGAQSVDMTRSGQPQKSTPSPNSVPGTVGVHRDISQKRYS